MKAWLLGCPKKKWIGVTRVKYRSLYFAKDVHQKFLKSDDGITRRTGVEDPAVGGVRRGEGRSRGPSAAAASPITGWACEIVGRGVPLPQNYRPPKNIAPPRQYHVMGEKSYLYLYRFVDERLLRFLCAKKRYSGPKFWR